MVQLPRMSYNQLTGEATLLRQWQYYVAPPGTPLPPFGVGVATYSAWRFAANAPALTQVGTTPGVLQLSGDAGNYDSAPAALIFDYLRQTPNPTDQTYTGSVDNYVAIAPTKQDFTQDGGPTVLKFDAPSRNENEQDVGRGSSALCLSCFFADSLAAAPYFKSVQSTSAGAFTATPFVPSTCPYAGGTECLLPAGYIAYPAVGVIVKRFNGFLGPITAVTPTGIGEWTTNGNACKGVPAITVSVN